MAGRTVVVTGAGTGIGRATAAAFAADGDVVVLLGRRSGVLSQAAGEIGGEAPSRVRWRQCDVSDPPQVESFVAWLTRDVSDTLDVLVNNAGGGTLTGAKPPPGSSIAEAARFAHVMLATNLVGAYLMTHAARPVLRRPGGRIVNRYLASPEASFVTGEVLHVNGGQVFGR